MLVKPFYGEKHDHRYHRLAAWAAKQFGAADTFTRAIKDSEPWVKTIVEMRNAVDHPGEARGGKLLTENFNLGGTRATPELVDPMWGLSGHLQRPIVAEMKEIVEGIIELGEEILAGLFHKFKLNFPLVIYEIPPQERDAMCPIRLRVGFAQGAGHASNMPFGGGSQRMGMDHTELRKEVFAWYGAAAYYAQCIEVELIIARLFLARRRMPQPSGAEMDEIERDKRTMGSLLKLLTVALTLDSADAALLNRCLEDRNFLAHEYWYRRSSLLFTAQGCCTAVTELREMSERLKTGNTVAEGISRRIRASLGISEELVHKLQVEFIDGCRSGQSAEQILSRQVAYLKSLGSNPRASSG